jgi:hypothetical protein
MEVIGDVADPISSIDPQLPAQSPSAIEKDIATSDMDPAILRKARPLMIQR